MRNLPVRAALGLAAACLLAACTSAAEQAGSPDPEEPTAAPWSASVQRYVALGDSYTAAPMIAGKMSDDGCFRSSNNYPALLARDLPGATVVDRSCSAATTRDLTHRQRTVFGAARPPQLAALTRDTDLVTVGIGGNDLDVFQRLVGTCTALRRSDPTGDPCHRSFTRGGTDTMLRDAARVEGRVTAVLDAVQRRAPDARIVVVDYPVIVPEAGTCPRRLPMATGDYPWAHRVNERLSRSLRDAAGRAGVEHLDVAAASTGHDVCAGADAWVNGQRTEPGTALAYHPLAAGQQAVAGLLRDLLAAPPA
ncbi:SGNH/GDSL hydrolase family protein [Nocardioides guangzhouensis]|uniref:SGNH/GDSL hydrolase family protein n=1 Tax=Nocardioides guangzhouensis TaxID=2497878 RepID=A0A4Q4ZN81_9ACTN|nr:SGNH/GDSL hydrolase family protein [Nocardioides guangzhouensis]RYP88944.1 SGNH/GDSL hydrolase family protein [Nocardioides guangzhouensis]